MPVVISNTEREIMHWLKLRFGFIPHLPPQLEPGQVPDSKALLRALGLAKTALPDDSFFSKPLGIAAVNFISRIIAQPPNATEECDLFPPNRQFLGTCRRLKCITIVTSKEGPWYMFDFGPSSTVPWKLAVQNPLTALYICRMEDALTDEELALELLSHGIPFQTLQASDSFTSMETSGGGNMVPYRPRGYKYTSKDYDIYRQQCNMILSSSRGRAALLHGGFIWRIAKDTVGRLDVLRGPSGKRSLPEEMFVVTDRNGREYIDDKLTNVELDLLCGIYYSYTGMHYEAVFSSHYLMNA
jgi:hypothetical protein